jgi:hypothetical protein
MNTESIDCRRVQFGEMERPGDFTFNEEFDCIYVWLPGRLSPDALHIQKGPQGPERVWGWDGNEVFPTLTPSIHDVGYWHGHMQNGRLVSC